MKNKDKDKLRIQKLMRYCGPRMLIVFAITIGTALILGSAYNHDIGPTRALVLIVVYTVLLLWIMRIGERKAKK